MRLPSYKDLLLLLIPASPLDLFVGLTNPKKLAVRACLVVVLLIVIRLFVEARFIPSSSMEPAMVVGDKVILEKLSKIGGAHFQRGDIVIFYPPPIELGGQDLKFDPLSVLGRLTGLPFLPYEPAYIKRIIGLPGDRIEIKPQQGVFVNGALLDEGSYIQDFAREYAGHTDLVRAKAEYGLNVLGDIGGRSTTGGLIRPYGDPSQANNAIVVPPNQTFVLGDNRNNSEDSHVWGFLDNSRIIGRVWVKFHPRWEWIERPKYR